MKICLLVCVFLSSTLLSLNMVAAQETDSRQYVQMPVMMQQHMMSNMRDHLLGINEILALMAKGELDAAAEIAETRLGMSAMESHGAKHIGALMPEGMRRYGTQMHRAASQLARKLEEGEALPAYKMLPEVTSACVGCHAGYRIR